MERLNIILLAVIAVMGFNIHANELNAPVGVRPCCAFGVDLKAQLGSVPVPFFSLENVVDKGSVGDHHYNDGSASISGSLLGLADETNGLVFTKLGGFIDTAHVRDTADYTYYIFQLNQGYLGTSHHIDLPAELRLRRVTWHPQTQPLSKEQKITYSAEAAALTAFRLAQWHEIAQWFGMVSVGGFDELASAFSSEDLYSNMLGAHLAKQILIATPTLNTKQFSAAMDHALETTLSELNAVTKSVTKEKIQQLDGIWWDSSKRLPNKWALIYRDYHLSLSLMPNYPTATHRLQLSETFDNNQPIEQWLSVSFIAANEEDAFDKLPSAIRTKSSWSSQDFQSLANYAQQVDKNAMSKLGIQAHKIKP
ncbi:DUF4056 domain-containing protein, partial [Vibrio sinaloensis]|uniref:DUF4056 domain-containing protein n=1 Tax=Photobacterium sp. (strain ATCC 43367) TaxID=379097 RepID=UPI002F414F12